MGIKMQNAPVYYALVQVRFNPIEFLSQYVPKIQDTFRKAGFADFHRILISTVQMGGREEAAPDVQQRTRFLFLNTEKTAGFSVDHGSIAFQTTAYDTFPPFVDDLFKGLTIVHDAVEGLTYSERIGMRMLDAVVPKPDERLSQYLKPSILGLFDKFETDELIHSVSETRTKRGKTILVGRAIIQKRTDKGNVTFPSELLPVPLEVAARFQSLSGLYGILDTDCWLEERSPFDLVAMKDTLKSLKEGVDLSFSHMVTKHALDVWK